MSPAELNETQIRILQVLVGRGFAVVSFPRFPAQIGVREGECAALLEPVARGGFKMVGEPTYLVAGELSAKVTRGDGAYFVWKSHELRATPERVTRLEKFTATLAAVLAADTQSD